MLNKYPRVNYIGNKEKLTNWIIYNLPIKEGKVLDLFAGGCSVAYKLKEKGFQVLTNDALYSSYVISKAIIENSRTHLDETIIEEALHFSISKEIINSYMWLKNKLYFEYEVIELAKLVEFSKTLYSYEKYLFLSLIRRAMIRKLPYSRMTIPWENIVKLRNEEYSYEKYGRRRAYHNESFINHIQQNLDDYNKAIFNNGENNKSFQLDAISMLKQIDQVDLIYMDPPYPGTMNNYDAFYNNFDKIFDKIIEHKNLTNKAFFLENIKEILDIARHKTKYIILSINSNTSPSLSEIVDLFNYYGKVSIKERKHNYQISGKEKKSKNIEMMITLNFLNDL